MTEQLSQALKQLRDVLRAESHDHCTGVRVLFTYEGCEIEYRTRTPESLYCDGISMRNLRGAWVKE